MFIVLACSFFFIGPAVSQVLGLDEGEPCEALSEESGTCQLLTECMNPGDFKKHHPPICTFQGKIPVICCPDSTGLREVDFRFGSKRAIQNYKNDKAGSENDNENAVSDNTMKGRTAKSYANNFMVLILIITLVLAN
ncbi:uncharacterized protein [Halyomorpha halys]|uniref:uncharacterized protein n=1 Tax=Halyomorpha halys TaxID=286706 RepID=UPI0006D51DBD|nr:uncharacterized protein LOC106686359 [Halyomorpha halys]